MYKVFNIFIIDGYKNPYRRRRADIRKTLQYNLAKESYDVATAGSISEAKSITNQNQPDLIILDLMLPDGSVWTL